MAADIRVVIADDHPIFRHGLQQVVEAQPDMQVVAAVGDGATALDVIRRSSPDVAVLDVRMPGLGGFDVAKQAGEEGLRTRLMFLTMHAEPVMFERAMAMGVKGYVLKDAALSEIVQAVRTIAIGRKYLSPALSDYLAGTVVSLPPRRASRVLAAGRAERARAAHPSPDCRHRRPARRSPRRSESTTAPSRTSGRPSRRSSACRAATPW